MLEKHVENYFKKRVEEIGGRTYKFTSPAHRGVADRIACLPDGLTWFVEIKTVGGTISPLQRMFAMEMFRLKQNYTVLWSKENVDEWIKSIGFI
jgi:hypothetical protein